MTKKIEKRKRFAKLVAEADRKRVQTGKNVITGGPTINPETQRNLKARGYCGAKRRRKDEEGGVQYCRRKAGWGTDHPGIGCCRNHAGNTPTARASAERRYQIEFMGRPKDISPLDAIIWAIKITAGEVEWLSQQIAEINNKEDWYEFTVVGKQMNVLQRTRADAMDRLVRFSKDAIALGLAERAVRMAEQFGATIARLLEGIQRDLKLDKAQTTAWPIIVRKHLILLEGGIPVDDEDRKKVPAVIEARARSRRTA